MKFYGLLLLAGLATQVLAAPKLTKGKTHTAVAPKTTAKKTSVLAHTTAHETTKATATHASAHTSVTVKPSKSSFKTTSSTARACSMKSKKAKPSGKPTAKPKIVARSPDPTAAQIRQAIEAVAAKLQAKGIKYGLLGGMAMQLLGMPDRTTTDFDMAIDASAKDMKAALAGDAR